jgi:hypothetical protein
VVALLGYAAAVAIAIAIVWRLAGLRHMVAPDPTFELTDVGPRYVSILGGLSGFAVTGVVLLVGQTANLAGAGANLTTVLAMFVVAYMGLLSVGFQFASISDKVRSPFDMAAAQFAGASISLYFIYVGWFALRPLFQAFGLTEVADITSWLLLLANLAGFPLLASALYRSGYASARVVTLLPLIVVLVVGAYVLVVRALVPAGYVTEATLVLTLVGFVPGAAMYAAGSALPLLARQERLAPILAERWHLVVLGYAVSVMVLVELLLVSVLGIA